MGEATNQSPKPAKTEDLRVPDVIFNASQKAILIGMTLAYGAVSYGAHNIPRSGPVILAANHQSYLDPPAIGCMCRRRLDFVARLGLFNSDRFGRLISAFGALPIREDGVGDTRAIKELLARLEKGRAVLIFPEASRSPDGAMQPFKRGVSILVKRSRCPVVPIAIEGAFDAWPRGGKPSFWSRRVAVAYGQPIGHEEIVERGAEAGLDRIAHEIDALRLDLRATLRQQSGGRYPRKGPGDLPITRGSFVT